MISGPITTHNRFGILFLSDLLTSAQEGKLPSYFLFKKQKSIQFSKLPSSIIAVTRNIKLHANKELNVTI